MADESDILRALGSIERAVGGLETKSDLILDQVRQQGSSHNVLAREVSMMRSDLQAHLASPHPSLAHLAWLEREIRHDFTSEEKGIEQKFTLRTLLLSLGGSVVTVTLVAPLAGALFKHWGI